MDLFYEIKPKPELLEDLNYFLNESSIKEFYIDDRYTVKSCREKDITSDQLIYDNIEVKDDYTFELSIIGQFRDMEKSPLQKLLKGEVERLDMWRIRNSEENHNFLDDIGGIFCYEVYKIEM